VDDCVCQKPDVAWIDFYYDPGVGGHSPAAARLQSEGRPRELSNEAVSGQKLRVN